MSKEMNEPTVNANEISRISAGTLLKGEINSPNDIRIDGTLKGRIFSKGRVVAGNRAVIEGDVVCDNADLFGKITGSLIVRDTLSLKNGCAVEGDLRIKRLVVELGARFDGNCKMIAEGEFEKLSGLQPGANSPKAAPQPIKVVAGK